MTTSFIISSFATLFVVMNPVGLVPIFIALNQGLGTRARRAVALRACLVAAGILTLFGLAGDAILSFVGITLPAFRIAGGMLLFLTALEMLFSPRSQAVDTDMPQDPSVFPLATPLIAGPGAIATMILLIGQGGNSWAVTGVMIGLMLVMAAITFVFLLIATPLERALSRTGTLVVTRLLGMLLAALAVQFVLDGMRGAGMFGVLG